MIGDDPETDPLVLQTIDIGSGKGVFLTVVLKLLVNPGVQMKIGTYTFAAIRERVGRGVFGVKVWAAPSPDSSLEAMDLSHFHTLA